MRGGIRAEEEALVAGVCGSAQRQTMLKMYTSDVCDTGQAFTKQGTRLRWVLCPFAPFVGTSDQNVCQNK
jgi:hypothetical protein